MFLLELHLSRTNLLNMCYLEFFKVNAAISALVKVPEDVLHVLFVDVVNYALEEQDDLLQGEALVAVLVDSLEQIPHFLLLDVHGHPGEGLLME